MREFCHYTKQQVLERTREVLHHFANKEMEKFIAHLDKNFVWIGDYEALYTKGIDAFMKTISYEAEHASVKISEEEYMMLTHERKLWVTYGRFTMTGNENDGDALITKVHFTFTWVQRENDLKLMLANATHVKSVSFPVIEEPPKPVTQSMIFEQSTQYETPYEGSHKLMFKDMKGGMRYLYPEEVLYIHSDNKLCIIHTGSEAFSTRRTISSVRHPQFLHIHRSYIVNKRYVKEVKRYQVMLYDGTVLPIGKDKYKNVLLAMKEN